MGKIGKKLVSSFLWRRKADSWNIRKFPEERQLGVLPGLEILGKGRASQSCGGQPSEHYPETTDGVCVCRET